MRSEYSHLVPVIRVKDLNVSLEFYQKFLNWNVSFTWGDPVEYAAVSDGGKIQLHLTHDERPIDPYALILRIFVPDVRSLYKRMQNEDVVIDEPLHLEDYGMVEFSLRDPDGYRLVFGTGEELLKP